VKPHAKQRLYRSAESAAPPKFSLNVDVGVAVAPEIQIQTLKSSALRHYRVSWRNWAAIAESFPPKSRVQSTKAIDWQSIWGVGFDKVTKTVINGVWEWASFVSAEW
jgi:hypothetical protein